VDEEFAYLEGRECKCSFGHGVFLLVCVNGGSLTGDGRFSLFMPYQFPTVRSVEPSFDDVLSCVYPGMAVGTDIHNVIYVVVLRYFTTSEMVFLQTHPLIADVA
jgi:hypothetical protein